MTGIIQAVPVEFAVGSGFALVGMGHLWFASGIRKAGELRKLAASPLGGRLAQLAVKITEEQKRGGGRELFAHKKEWRRRCQQADGKCRRHGVSLSDSIDAFPQSAVAYLVEIGRAHV